jgi:hypothetical protein
VSTREPSVHLLYVRISGAIPLVGPQCITHYGSRRDPDVRDFLAAAVETRRGSVYRCTWLSVDTDKRSSGERLAQRNVAN